MELDGVFFVDDGRIAVHHRLEVLGLVVHADGYLYQP
jgi:hypothetical protein